MWHVRLMNPIAPKTEIAVDQFEDDTDDPRKIEIRGLQCIFQHYTTEQLKGFSYSIQEHSEKRRRIMGKF